jgi:hypothetical protein
MVPTENDKPTVIALREIAQGLVKKEPLEDEPPMMSMEDAAGEETTPAPAADI